MRGSCIFNRGETSWQDLGRIFPVDHPVSVCMWTLELRCRNNKVVIIWDFNLSTALAVNIWADWNWLIVSKEIFSKDALMAQLERDLQLVNEAGQVTEISMGSTLGSLTRNIHENVTWVATRPGIGWDFFSGGCEAGG